MFLSVLYTIYWLLPIAGLALGFYLDLEDIKEKKEKSLSNKKDGRCYTVEVPLVLCLFAFFLSVITKIISSFWI